MTICSFVFFAMPVGLLDKSVDNSPPEKQIGFKPASDKP
jgi:hypothetical protein